MSEEGQSQKKRWLKKGNNEDDMPVEHEGDTDNENIAQDKMEVSKRSSPRRKYLKETGYGALEKIDMKGKNKGDDDSSEEAEAGDEVKSKPSKSEDEEYVPEPPAKRRRLVRSVQENVSSEEDSQGKKSKPVKGRKGKKRAAKRITPKKSKASKKKAEAEQDEGEYEVEKIVKVKILKNGKKEFLIRWKGFSAEHDTWEPEANLTCKELVNQYFEEHPEEIEAPAEEEKKNKKGKSKRRRSSRPSGPKISDSAADAEGSAKGNAKKGKGNSKKSRGKGKKKQTRSRNTGAKSGKDETAVTDSERDGDGKTKKTEKAEGKNTSKSTGNSPGAEVKGQHSGTSESGSKKEYEVEKIVDIRQRKEGGRQFLIKWRGYSSKFNSWESENNMNCNEKIEKFLRSMQQSFTERELRVVRKRTNRFVADNRGRGRKLSVRLGKMPRKSYSEID